MYRAFWNRPATLLLSTIEYDLLLHRRLRGFSRDASYVRTRTVCRRRNETPRDFTREPAGLRTVPFRCNRGRRCSGGGGPPAGFSSRGPEDVSQVKRPVRPWMWSLTGAEVLPHSASSAPVITWARTWTPGPVRLSIHTITP